MSLVKRNLNPAEISYQDLQWVNSGSGKARKVTEHYSKSFFV